MKKIKLTVFLVLCCAVHGLSAQADCVLGVGVTNDTIISEVFQLNEAQHEKLVNFSAEIKYRNELLNRELENIMNRPPQSSVSELEQLAKKYKSVMDSMERVQTIIDKRMLALFNLKQYGLYRSLCKEASRSPYIIVPTVYSDSVNNQNR